jgi:ABC-type antimicrobial peptide transport system ATPase subunit
MGENLPPLLILKRKTLLKSESFPKDVIDRAQEELMLEWQKIAFLNQPSMLVLDAFRGHVTGSMKDQLRKMKSELVIVGGMTLVLQPMDIAINKPFKDRLSRQYLT